MPLVSCSDGSNVAGMSRCREPVMDGGPDGAPPHRKLAGSLVPGDQQQEALASRYCPVERSIDCPPRTIEAHSMKIDDAVGLDRSIAQAPIPAAVERRSRPMVFLTLRSVCQWGTGGALRNDKGSYRRLDRFAVILVA